MTQAIQAHTQRRYDTRSCPRACRHAGCERLTRHSKDYCSTHILELPYPRMLYEKAEALEQEAKDAAVKGADAVDVKGPMTHEILRCLHLKGSRTQEALGKDIEYLNGRASSCFATALDRAGLVALDRTTRGAFFVTLTPRGRDQFLDALASGLASRSPMPLPRVRLPRRPALPPVEAVAELR